MFKIIGLIVLALVAAVLLYAATRPDSFRIERSIVVQAPPQRIHAQIEDFHRWQAWSPFEEMDPQMKREIAGAPAGTGAVYLWDGNSKAGAGRMEILESTPACVRIQLDFTRPMAARNTAEFLLAPDGDGTRVTWAMHGPQPYIGKVMSLVFDMDAMVGKDFERGLANLKRLAEQG